MRRTTWMGLLLPVLFWTIAVQATEYLDINVEEVRVYQEPDTSSRVVTTLFKGDSVPVSKKSPNGFKKVLVQNEGRKTIGFISNRELGKGAGKVRSGPSVRESEKAVGRKRYALGVSGGINYQNQAARDYQDGTTAASIGALSGLSNQFGLFFDFRLGKNLYARSFLEYKSVVQTGTATLKSVSPTSATDTYFEEKFLSLGALLKVFSGPSSSFWYGGGLEYDRGLSGSLKFGTYPRENLTASELSSFVYLFGVLGVDMDITRSLFLTSDFRLGAIVNTTPPIYGAELRLGLGYKF